MKCKLCPKKLGLNNKSGYCVKCFPKSPKGLEYMRIRQAEWYAKPENKEKQKVYRNQPKVKAYQKKYQKKWVIEHKDRMRFLKREWARKQRLNPEANARRKEYQKKWKSKNREKIRIKQREWKRKNKEQKK